MITLRTTIVLVFGMGLAAQFPHFDQGTLITEVEGQYRYVGGIVHHERHLQLLDATGSIRRILPPPGLGQHRGYIENLGHWKGTSYALAVATHPVFSRLGDFWNPKDHTNRRDFLPRVLYRSLDEGSWEAVATHHRDPYCNFNCFLPLEDGRFLVDRWILPFELEGRRSPFAIYRVDNQGRAPSSPASPPASWARSPAWSWAAA